MDGRETVAVDRPTDWIGHGFVLTEVHMDSPSQGRFGFWSGATLGVFFATIAFFLWSEHRAHVYGAIPYILVLLCVLVLFLFLRSRGNPTEGQAMQGQSAGLRVRKEDDDAR